MNNDNSHSGSMNDNNAEKDSGSATTGNDDLNNELSSMSIDNSHSKKKKYYCLHCLKEVSTTLRCSRCETAIYCGRECQVKHWPVHKNSCQDSNNTEDDNKKLNMKALNHYNQGNSKHIYQSVIITNIIIYR
jgi:hypothetical protein